VSAIGYQSLVMEPVSPSVRTVAFAVAELRQALGWTQAELGRRADVSQAFVSMVENMRVPDITLETAARLLEALGARLNLGVSAPFLADRELQRDPVHARCSSYVVARLKRAGWLTAAEVEIGGDRSRGWIDVLAYEPRRRLVLVIEIKTEIRDVGAIERTLGWYERESWVAARRSGWRPNRVLGCLLLLATETNETRIGDNLAAFNGGFPIRAATLREVIGSGTAAERSERALALIDPRSRREDWLRPSRFDGRPTPAPYVDYADFMRVASQVRRRPAA
jgi:transcriptional regulator with XRE-family HTH domain